MRYPKVGENGGRKTTSVQRNENILLLYLGGCKILGDSIPRTGMKTNKQRMNGRYQTNSRRSHTWCFVSFYPFILYVGAARIINDTVMALTRKKKPTANDRSDRYLHVSAILAALQRLEKLVCSNPTLGIELKECLYSRNTLTSLTKLLTSKIMMKG